MEKDSSVPSTPTRFKWRFFYLLIALVFLLIIGPFVEGFVGIRMVLDIFFSVIILLCVYAISEKRYQIIIGIILAIPMLLSLWLRRFVIIKSIIIIGDLSGIALMAFVIISIISFIFRQKEVATDLITGAAVAYLLMGVMWSFIYSFTEMIHPGSFALSGIDIADPRFSFIYYSFVTITTLGYGDITPLTRLACSFSILEAITGQLFLVIQVAWLVGLHVSQTMRKRSQ